MSVYKQAFVELKGAVLEEARGLFDNFEAGLVQEAEKRAQQFSDWHIAYKHHNRFENAEKFLGYVCPRFGMRFHRWTRSAWDRETVVGVVLECGHKGSFQIDDRLIEAGHIEDVVDHLINTLRDIPDRRCSCVLRDREIM